MMDVHEFVARQQKLLQIERDEEDQQTQERYKGASVKYFAKLQSRGDALLNMRAWQPSDEVSSLEGLTLIRLTTTKESKLPMSRLTVGDNISIQSMDFLIKKKKPNKKQSNNPLLDKNNEIRGVIYKMNETSITAAVDSLPDEEDLGYSLFHTNLLILKLSDDVTYKRLQKALEKIDKLGTNSYAAFATSLSEILLFQRQPATREPTSVAAPPDFEYYNKNLNQYQQEAIQFCLRTPDIGLIHGPPGTGKTTTVAEFILQSARRGEKVLACASSNIAVDNLVLALQPYVSASKQTKPRVIRVGHPARMLTNVLPFSLEHILQYSEGTQIVEDVRNEIKQITLTLSKLRVKADRVKAYNDLRYLRKELKRRQRKAVKDLLYQTDILLATNTGCDSKYLSMSQYVEEIQGFDVVVIDEAAQSLEVACWIPILLGKKVILAGDHLQLPPTIISEKACGIQKDGLPGLDQTLFDRLTSVYGEKITRMLSIQYRMNENIMQWSSTNFYRNRLTAASSVSKHLLCDLEHVSSTVLTTVPLCLIDTCGQLQEQKFDEDANSNHGDQIESKWNEGEADIVKTVVQQLLDSGVPAKDIGVITPYNAQVDLLNTLLSIEHLEIGSVDGFQGREKEAIVISMVRSNDKHEIGFLSEKRRMNVAITRARRLVVVVCDGFTICRDQFLNTMFQYFQSSEHCLYMTNEDLSFEQPDVTTKHVARQPPTISTVERSCHNQKVTNTNQKAARKEQKKTGTDADKQRKLPKNAESDNELRKNLRDKIDEFLANPNNTESITFPASLSSVQRKFVHQIAEELGLIHLTVQIDDERVITVSKPPPKTEESEESKLEEPEQKIELPIVTNQKQEEKQEQAPIGIVSKKKQKKKKGAKKPAPVNPLYVVPEKPKPIATPQSSNPKQGKKLGSDKNDNLDALLAQFRNKPENTCEFGTCMRPTNVTTEPCKYCKVKFCMNHNMAELHGCGPQARQQARQQFVEASSNKKPLTQAEKDHARSQIRNKINEASSGRKAQRGKKK